MMMMMTFFLIDCGWVSIGKDGLLITVTVYGYGTDFWAAMFVGPSEAAAMIDVHGRTNSILVLSADLLSFLYSAYLPGLVVPHMVVCRRFRHVLLGVDTVELRLEAAKCHALSASSFSRFRGEVRLILYTCEEPDETAKYFTHLSTILGSEHDACVNTSMTQAGSVVKSISVFHEGGVCPFHRTVLYCLSEMIARCCQHESVSRGSTQRKSKGLQTLMLRNIELSSDGAAFVCASLTCAWLDAALIQLQQAQSDTGADSSVGDADGDKFLRALRPASILTPQQATALHHLELDSCGIGVGGARHLAICIAALSASLTTVRLQSNDFGKDGIEVLAPALGMCLSLKCLRLDDNKMSAQGLGHLVTHVLAPSCLSLLTSLDVRANDLEAEDGYTLVAALVRLPGFNRAQRRHAGNNANQDGPSFSGVKLNDNVGSGRLPFCEEEELDLSKGGLGPADLVVLRHLAGSIENLRSMR